MKSCYHFIKTMTKFEKETRHWLIYVFIKKPTVNLAKCKTTASAHDAFCPLIQTWQLPQAWCVHCLITVQIVLVMTYFSSRILSQFWSSIKSTCCCAKFFLVKTLSNKVEFHICPVFFIVIRNNVKYRKSKLFRNLIAINFSNAKYALDIWGCQQARCQAIRPSSMLDICMYRDFKGLQNTDLNCCSLDSWLKSKQ